MAILRACFKNSPVRGPGLQGFGILAISCRPRALTRRPPTILKPVLRPLSSVSDYAKISRAKLASRMKTNRATLDRLFAQDETSATLQFLEQAALALGRSPLR